MRLHGFVTSCIIVLLIVLLSAPPLKAGTGQQEKQWVVFHKDIPESAVRFNVSLEYSPSRQNFCQLSQELRAEALPENRKNKGYKQQINITTAIDGYQYRLLFGEASDLNLLSRDAEQLFKVEIIRWEQNRKPEIFKEGYMMLGREIEIPFQICGNQMNLPVSGPVSGAFMINIYNSDRTLLRGDFRTHIDGQLSGSALTEGAALNVSITSNDSLKLEDRNVNLNIKPFDKNIQSSSASSKITDIFDIRGAKLAVEKVTSDCSQLVLAVLHGDLNQSSEQLNKLILNKPVPNFARVELVQRKLVTLKDLKAQAGTEGHIVMLFGEFKENLPPGMMPGRMPSYMPMSELALDETAVSKILRQDIVKPLVIVFVCQSLQFGDLYEKWLDRNPEFLIISDFGNPMNTRFQIPFRGGPMPYYNERTITKETLREFFGIAENKVAVLLINGQGDLLYMNKDAGQQFSETLTGINTLMKK